MSVKINKVVLKIGEKEVNLSVDDAKELMRLLMDTFGEKETKVITIPQIIEREVYPWEIHYIPPYYYPPWKVTWGGTTAGYSTGTSITFQNDSGNSYISS
jgi:hypothetical protein